MRSTNMDAKKYIKRTILRSEYKIWIKYISKKLCVCVCPNHFFMCHMYKYKIVRKKPQNFTHLSFIFAFILWMSLCLCVYLIVIDIFLLLYVHIHIHTRVYKKRFKKLFIHKHLFYIFSTYVYEKMSINITRENISGTYIRNVCVYVRVDNQWYLFNPKRIKFLEIIIIFCIFSFFLYFLYIYLLFRSKKVENLYDDVRLLFYYIRMCVDDKS